MLRVRGIVVVGLLCVSLLACGTNRASDVISGKGGNSTANTNPKGAVIRDMKGAITSFEKYGHAVLNIPISEFLSNGFELGDGVTVEFSNGYVLKDIPFYNGYYVKKGDPLLRAYPGHKFAAVCINYGKINEAGNLKEGDSCSIRLTAKAKFYREQALNSLMYSDKRSDFESDSVFANFRNVQVGGIGKGKLYRSASPIDNSHSRAVYADQLMQGARIGFVLNLSDSKGDVNRYTEMDDFRSSYYVRLFDAGRVLAISLNVDFSSPEFKNKLVSGLCALADSAAHPPLLVHCTEGKNRTGFVSALLEALMGATYDEIVDDYMITYENYYGITRKKDARKYATIVSNNIDEMLKTIVGVSDVRTTTGEALKEGAMRYLKSGGATDEQIQKLIALLS